MISTTEANEHTKFFTHNWTLTLSSHPTLAYTHLTTSNVDAWLALFRDPTNHPYDAHSREKIWDAAAVADFRKTTSEKYIASYTTLNALQWLISLDNEVIGMANFFLLPSGWVNIGLLITEKARGKGLGKLSMKVVVQLGRLMGVKKLEAGTMKANEPFQALMRGLGLKGEDHIIEAPGRGVVGEIRYRIPEMVGYEELDLRVEFGEPAPGFIPVISET